MEIKLLIVDDASFMREVVRQIVSAADILVVGEATNGIEAVQMALHKKPDVVLMDIIMPEKNGLTATKEILEQLPQTRVVACSTEGHEDMLLKALDAGCCHFVTKPFKKAELLQAILNSVKAAS